MRILLVEDDEALRGAVELQLRSQGWQAEACGRGDDAEYYWREGGYDAVLLDRMLPGLDGLTLLRRMRAGGDATPVLLLTALADIGARVDGLDAGADDYLPKPFDMRALLARVRALGRRAGAGAETLTFGDLTWLPASLLLTGGAGQCTLTRKEGELLEALLRQKGGAVSRSALFARLWGAGAEVDDACLDTYAYYLRRRLRAVSARVSLVTVRGVGYRLAEDPC